MPMKSDREYRSMLLSASDTTEKRIDTEFYVEGYASTFDDPYTMYEMDGWKYTETIDRNALNNCDMSDIIMQYDHTGRVYARKSNNSLIVEPDNHGIFIAADLGLTEGSRGLHEDIKTGLITKMSWGFVVDAAKDVYTQDKETKTVNRRIMEVRKIYDVSAVSIPANPGTDICARSWIGGAIEKAKQEKLMRERMIMKLKLEGF